ncbi:MAG: hypothetical protein GX483_01945 [Actinomycetaceae bacterium]|nr:hypothetical protein [Actinomycetaceae bacterium]
MSQLTDAQISTENSQVIVTAVEWPEEPRPENSANATRIDLRYHFDQTTMRLLRIDETDTALYYSETSWVLSDFNEVRISIPDEVAALEPTSSIPSSLFNAHF